MDNVTIGQILGIIAGVTAVIKFIQLIYELIKKSTLDKISRNSEDIKQLKLDVGVLKSEIQDGKEEKIIILKGLLACLKGLKEQGCDGAVETSISDIENYLMKKSHN